MYVCIGRTNVHICGMMLMYMRSASSISMYHPVFLFLVEMKEKNLLNLYPGITDSAVYASFQY